MKSICVEIFDFVWKRKEHFCRFSLELWKVIKYDAISSECMCICIESCVFERKSSSISNAWIHLYIDIVDKREQNPTIIPRRKRRNWWNGFLECHIALKYVSSYKFMSLWFCDDFTKFRIASIKFNCYRKSLEPFPT